MPDQVLRQVVLRDPRVVLARERGQRDHRSGRGHAASPGLEGEPHGNHVELRQGPVRVVREEDGIGVGVEAQRRQVGLPHALEDQVDVGPLALDQVEVHEDEEDVVVGRDQVRARRERPQQRRAEVLGDAVAAPVERCPARDQERERDRERQHADGAGEPLEHRLAADAGEQRRHHVGGDVVAVPEEEVAPRAVRRHGGDVAEHHEEGQEDRLPTPPADHHADRRQHRTRPGELGREAPEPVTENHGYVGRALDPGARPEVAPEDDVEEGAKRLRVPPVETRVHPRADGEIGRSPARRAPPAAASCRGRRRTAGWRTATNPASASA